MSAPIHIAVVGGSGSGKTWLAEKLFCALAPRAAHVCLDDFYRDLALVPKVERDAVNFDDPAAIDWEEFRRVIGTMQTGQNIDLPLYDFATHTRREKARGFSPPPLVVWEGLWLLHHQSLRAHFALTVFVDCGVEERFRRRAERDVFERGRTLESVRQQFFAHVDQMHGRFVEPQRRLASRVISSPFEAGGWDGLLIEVQRVGGMKQI